MPHKHLPIFGLVLIAASLLHRVIGSIVVTVLFAILLLHKAKKAGHTPEKTAILGAWFGAILGFVMGLIVVVEDALGFVKGALTLMTGIIAFALAGVFVFYIVYLLVRPGYDLRTARKLLKHKS